MEEDVLTRQPVGAIDRPTGHALPLLERARGEPAAPDLVRDQVHRVEDDAGFAGDRFLGGVDTARS